MHKYTDEEIEFLSKYVPGHHYREIVNEFNKRFGTDFEMKTIVAVIKRHGFKTGFNGQFKKGHVSHNKGKRVSPETYEKMKATMFKKGNVPIGTRPIGSERINAEGYVEVKVAEPNVWKFKARIVWEEENGEIPENHYITYADGDKTNCDISNLRCITINEHLFLNRNHLNNSGEYMDTSILIAKLDGTIRERRNKNEHD